MPIKFIKTDCQTKEMTGIYKKPPFLYLNIKSLINKKTESELNQIRL